jgi:UDP-N-acetylmuramate--alanine ligase
MDKHVHFIGIGGSGLSAIATVLLERGYTVSGSDRQASPVTRRLQEAGMTIFIAHRPENVAGADLVVRSSAIPDDNVEVQAARAAGLSVLKRVDFLEQFTAGQQPLAVAGTHGKTTTTALLAWLLTALGKDPSYVIGGVSANLAGNAHAGHGQYFVIEADEYDHMFLGLRPWVEVVTNVEHDHPDCYPTARDFEQAFEAFVDRLMPGGTLLACADDPGAASILGHARQQGYQAVSYSLQDQTAGFQARDARSNSAGGFTFALYRSGRKAIAAVQLQVPGLHNVLNALAALGVVDLLGFSLAEAAWACAEFRGTGRRFELRGEINGITIIDDYAHHPTEIRATLAAARTRFPGRCLWVVWQPHTYSRTRTLQDEFVNALQAADRLVITDIFAAREAPPADGYSSRQIAELLARAPHFTAGDVYYQPTLAGASALLLSRLQPGDVVLVLSAGDADQISAQLVKSLSALPPADLSPQKNPAGSNQER